ncbi:MAG: hypothetical protein IJ379_10805 [Lachnospiraceae bacterium]|nr:hypothetical protein [Lachnospiraceae bacterium]
MEGTRIFTSIQNSSVKNLFKKEKEEGMFLKVEGKTVSGKGNICNAEGRNGYQDEFSFSIQEIGDIKEEDYNGVSALAFTAQLKGLYGNKKVKIYIPQLKQPAEAISTLKKLKAEVGGDSIVTVTPPSNPTPVGASAKTEPAPAPAPTPAPTPAPAVEPAPAPAPAPQETKTIYKPVGEDYAGGHAPEKVAPAPAPEPAPAPAPEPAPEPKVEEVKPVVEEVASSEMSEEEFQKRMDKLNVLKDCGLLGEKEFTAKKLELVSEFFDLGDFNERIQKLIALKDCGLLSDNEFEQNRIEVIKECCDLDVHDIKEYRRNVQKLAFLEIGEVITPAEYAKSKQNLIDDVAFKVEDDKDTFVRKLRRLPVLQDCHLIEEADFDKKVSDLIDLLEVTKNDSRESLVNKLTKWPLLAQENYMAVAELKSKQDNLITTYLDVPWKTPDELKAIINRMSALKEGECLSEDEYQSRRAALLQNVDEIEEYSTKIAMYRMLPQVGFITEAEYDTLKQKCIDKIFTSSSSVAEFKERANQLVELQKVGMLTTEEFNAYKTKLMSEL